MTSTLSRHLGTPAPIPAVPPACPALSATPAVGPVRKPCWDPLRASWEVLGRGQRDDPWGGRPVQWLGTGARWLQDFQGKRELEQSHRSSLAPPNQGHIGAGRSLRAWEGGYSSAFGCLSPAQGQQVPPGWQDWTGLTWGGGGRWAMLRRELEAAGSAPAWGNAAQRVPFHPPYSGVVEHEV